MLLLFNALAHFCVDGLCASALFGKLQAPGTGWILLYDTLAFSTQCLVGLAADRLKRQRGAELVSAALLAAGWFLPGVSVLHVWLLGLGNSLFHVAGGVMTMKRSGGKAADLGLFVAPGAMGLTLGMLFPQCGGLFTVLLLICAAGAYSLEDRTPEDPVREHGGSGLTAPLLLTLAVAVRAVGGAAVSFPWKTGVFWTLALTVCVVAGKMAGGAICDRLGPGKTALWSVPAAALLIAFGCGFAAPSLMGQFLLNLSMPVTLWLMYRHMPEDPGFAFGLAASALWPGTIAGQWMTLTGPALWVCVLVSFGFGLWAVLIASKQPDSVPASGKGDKK